LYLTHDQVAEAIRVLESMKATLLELGWVQKMFGNTKSVPGGGGVCLIGAYIAVEDQEGQKDYGRNHPAIRALATVLGADSVSSAPLFVAYFNDKSSTTFNDILDAIDRAIIFVKESAT
jgi:hypothetical protein